MPIARIGAHCAGTTMNQDRLSLFQVSVGGDCLHAVWDAAGTDAASSNEMLDGFLAMAAALTARYSAYAPIPLVIPIGIANGDSRNVTANLFDDP